MIAVISVPAELADTLTGLRIWPFGSEQAKRAYALDTIPCPYPQMALAIVVWRDNDAKMIQWFADEQAAMMWATTDALKRSLGIPVMPAVTEISA